ncbi:MAG: c-type cytochrome [Vicinamibacterales bacterium]
MQTKFMAALAVCGSLLGVGLTRSVVLAQGAQTVWSGIYTAEQAARGKEKALAECGQCHGEMMEGALAPTLKGDDFIGHWYDAKLRELSDKVTMTMPQQAPGSLSPEDYADIMAYLLELNGFPAGQTALSLTPPEALDAITITKQQ